jgi:hypothetical protein
MRLNVDSAYLEAEKRMNQRFVDLNCGSRQCGSTVASRPVQWLSTEPGGAMSGCVDYHSQ